MKKKKKSTDLLVLEWRFTFSGKNSQLFLWAMKSANNGPQQHTSMWPCLWSTLCKHVHNGIASHCQSFADGTRWSLPAHLLQLTLQRRRRSFSVAERGQSDPSVWNYSIRLTEKKQQQCKRGYCLLKSSLFRRSCTLSSLLNSNQILNGNKLNVYHMRSNH